MHADKTKEIYPANTKDTQSYSVRQKGQIVKRENRIYHALLSPTIIEA